MKMKEYLRKECREPTPEWLEQYRKGQPLPLKAFLQSRTVFYPAAGYDGQMIAGSGGLLRFLLYSSVRRSTMTSMVQSALLCFFLERMV